MILPLLSASWGWSESDEIHKKNASFMQKPAFIEELYRNNQIVTQTPSLFWENEFNEQIITRRNLDKKDKPEISIQLYQKSSYTPEELNKDVEKIIDEKELLGEDFTEKQKTDLREYLKSDGDKEVIESAAIAIAHAPPAKIEKLFQKSGEFKQYVGKPFTRSELIEIDDAPSNWLFQYSEIQILFVEFAHALRYETIARRHPLKVRDPEGKISNEDLEGYSIAWEIDPRFQNHGAYPQKNVHVNSGHILIDPYVPESGIVDLSDQKSIILYHIYIKADPNKYPFGEIPTFLKGSVVRYISERLANAMRREAAKP